MIPSNRGVGPMTRQFSILRVVFIALALISGSCESSDADNTSPVNLIRMTVQNEIRSSNGGAKFRFKDYKETGHGSQTKMVIETHQATAGMLIAVDGKHLTAQERNQEATRLDGLANNPEELKKKQKAERDDTDRTMRIMKALPDAFIYERDNTPVTELGAPGHELVRFRFRPNTNYVPPTHTEQVLTGMSGYLLIDAKEHRIAEINGTLTKDVGFGWGILGRLDKGGRFVVVQSEVAPDDWEVTRMDLDFTGRELLFKKISIKSNEVCSDFQAVPRDISFKQAVDMLKKASAEWAENRQPNH